jgi:hypothetical protein
VPEDATIPVAYLHECFVADFEAGTLTWRERPREHFSPSLSLRAWRSWNGHHVGRPVLTVLSHGYPAVNLEYAGQSFKLHVHRVIWAMAHGRWPNTHTVLRLSDEAARRLKDRLGAATVHLANVLDGLLADADAMGKARTRKEVQDWRLGYELEREAIHRDFIDEMRDEKAEKAWHAFVTELETDLGKCLPEGEPRFGSWFDHLAHCLWRLEHEQRRWTRADIAYWRKVDSDVRERQRIRQAAIKDLENQLKEPGQSEEKMRRLAAAITALKAVMPSLPWGDMFGRRKPFEPVSLTARIIGGLTLATLRSAMSGRRLRRRTKLDAAAIDFIMARLDRCLGGDDLPDRKDIEKTLRGLPSR